MRFVKKLWKDEAGADLAEYALITGLVSLAVIVGAGMLGTGFNAWYQGLADWVGTLRRGP